MKMLFSGIDRETLKATSKALVKLEESMEMMK
jgi:hypothetical protein